MAGAGVAIGHDHLREGRPAQDGTCAPLILVADVVDDEALSGRKAKPETPLLPRDLMPVHAKTRPFRLGDLDRFEVTSQRANRVLCIVAVLLWDRNQAIVIDANDLHGVEV